MTIHLAGVIHSDPDSEPLVRSVIDTFEPDIVFLEVGEFRLRIMQSSSRIEKLFTHFRGRILELRPRGRVVRSAVAMKQLINSFRNGTVIGSVDMIPAIESGQNIEAEIIPIDMDQHEMMNKLGRSMFSIESILNFNPRERIEFIRSVDFEHNITTLEGLSKIDHNMSQIIPQRYNVLVTERNNLMVNNIQQSMNRNNTAVAILGALHLPGMVEQLQNRGFNVQVHL